MLSHEVSSKLNARLLWKHPSGKNAGLGTSDASKFGYTPLRLNQGIPMYDAQGNIINNLTSDYYKPGIHKVYWNAILNPSGVYFYEISNSKNLIRKKMMLIK